MSGKWTPGPWRQTSTGGLFIGSEGSIAAHAMAMKFTLLDDEQSQANARLIATSPELAEALKELYADARELLVSATSCADREALNADDLEERGFAPDSFAKARAALAKAKGEGA